MIGVLHLSAITLAAAAVLAGPPPAGTPPVAPPQPATLLLIDDTRVPTATIVWTTGDGRRIELAADLPYTVDAGRQPIGPNIAAFTAVGGTRLGKGAGHPRGAIVRIGFYKIDNAKPFFEGLAPGGQIHVRLANVAFNQPVDAHDASVVQHLKYSPDDLAECGLPGSARDQFNTASVQDTLNDRVADGRDARLGVLSGDDPSRGRADVTVEEDGTVTMEVTFAYPLLRHLQDPWQSDLPGTFLEPLHFHIEFEALPAGAAPLDWDALRAEAARERAAQGQPAAPAEAPANERVQPRGED